MSVPYLVLSLKRVVVSFGFNDRLLFKRIDVFDVHAHIKNSNRIMSNSISQFITFAQYLYCNAYCSCNLIMGRRC